LQQKIELDHPTKPSGKLCPVNTIAAVSHWYRRSAPTLGFSPTQGGIFPGKTGRIFPGNIEISQEILVENHALFLIFEGM
jgi:hypothetical protein